MTISPRALLSALLFTLLLFCLPGSAAFAAEASVIGGTVYVDKTYDGNPQGDQGLRGVQVTLKGDKGNRTERATTDSKGGYTFDELPAGEYAISITPPSGQEVTTAASITVKVDGRNATRVIDFGVAPVRVTATATVTPTASPTLTPTAGVPTPTAVSLTPAASPETISDDPARQAAINARSRFLGTPIATETPAVTPSPSPSPTPEGGRGGVSEVDPARLRAASLEPLRYAPGRDRMAAVKRYASGDTLWLGVPFRTQIDGTYFSLVNCGPASLSMVLAAFGIEVDPSDVREYVNFLSGNLDPDSGTSLDHIARVAREAGLLTLDLHGSRGYRAWDLDLIRHHINQGHPVITLARYQSLPGNARSLADTDHYIVITGLSGDDFIYNDAAFAYSTGYGLLISGEDLERAWEFSSNPRHGMAVALEGVPEVPPWIRSHSGSQAAIQAPGEEAEALPKEDHSIDIVTAGDEPIRFQDDNALGLALLDQIAAPRFASLDERLSIRESAEFDSASQAAMVVGPLADPGTETDVAPSRSGVNLWVLALLPFLFGLAMSSSVRRYSAAIRRIRHWRRP